MSAQRQFFQKIVLQLIEERSSILQVTEQREPLKNSNYRIEGLIKIGLVFFDMWKANGWHPYQNNDDS